MPAADRLDMATRFRSRSASQEHQTSVPVTDEMEKSAERLAAVWTALERFLSRTREKDDPAAARVAPAKWRKARVFAHLLRTSLEDEWEQFGGEPQTDVELHDLVVRVEKAGADVQSSKKK